MYNNPGDCMDGIILIDKAKGFTSHDVVAKLRGILKTKKIGHSGTLDPEATGLLVVGVNKGTKIMKFINQDEKIYQATAMVGLTTDTLDDDGTKLEQVEVKKIPSNIEEVIASFQGEYTFEIPMYSAVKVQGKKLYEYARQGQRPDVDLSKTVTIYDIHLRNQPRLDDGTVQIDYQVHASKGLYVRALSKDIGAKLGYPAYNLRLRRTMAGKFMVKDAQSLEELQVNEPKFIGLADALPFPKHVATLEEYIDIKHGRKVNIVAIDPFLSIVNEKNRLLAVYQLEANNTYKAVNVFLEGETDECNILK
jgi:tRNA pseudouridine55 synthase